MGHSVGWIIFSCHQWLKLAPFHCAFVLKGDIFRRLPSTLLYLRFKSQRSHTFPPENAIQKVWKHQSRTYWGHVSTFFIPSLPFLAQWADLSGKHTGHVCKQTAVLPVGCWRHYSGSSECLLAVSWPMICKQTADIWLFLYLAVFAWNVNKQLSARHTLAFNFIQPFRIYSIHINCLHLSGFNTINFKLVWIWTECFVEYGEKSGVVHHCQALRGFYEETALLLIYYSSCCLAFLSRIFLLGNFSPYQTHFSSLWSILKHRVWCMKNLLISIFLHLTVACLSSVRLFITLISNQLQNKHS